MFEEKDIKIRIAKISDAADLQRMNHQFNKGTVDKKHIADTIKNNKEIIVVAELHNNIVGFGCAQSFESICYIKPFGEITELYVQEEYRNLNIGTKIIEKLDEELMKRNVEEIKVITNKKNTAAQHTYAKRNYREKQWIVLIKETKGKQ